jgi:hypothetical protein
MTAARIRHDELKKRMTDAGLSPKPGDWAVSVAYVSVDLSALGLTPVFAPGNEAALMTALTGNIAFGLIFGMVDEEAEAEKDRFVIGAQPFIKMGQTDEWLSELVPVMQIVMNDGILDREIQKQS